MSKKQKKKHSGLSNQPVSKKTTLVKKKSNTRNIFIALLAAIFLAGIIALPALNSGSSIQYADTSNREPLKVGSFTEGQHFRILSNNVNATSMEDDKINVGKFLWYGCPFCGQLEPLTTSWSQQEDVNMGYIHPAIADGWRAHARIYYALEDSDLLQYHSNVMRGALENSARYTNPNAVTSLMSDESERTRFLQAYESGSSDKISEANRVFREAGLNGVPSIIIENRIVTGPSFVRNNRELIALLDSFRRNKEEVKAKLSNI